MLAPCFIYVLLLFFLIAKCYSNSLLKDHVVVQEYNVCFIYNKISYI